jgi:hypothetical protein
MKKIKLNIKKLRLKIWIIRQHIKREFYRLIFGI